jgi:hypothetical protein
MHSTPVGPVQFGPCLTPGGAAAVPERAQNSRCRSLSQVPCWRIHQTTRGLRSSHGRVFTVLLCWFRGVQPSGIPRRFGSAHRGRGGSVLVPGAAEAATRPKGGSLTDGLNWPPGPGVGIKPQPPDAQLRQILREIDPRRIEATIRKLVSFGTRHTLSAQNDPDHGIGAARRVTGSRLRCVRTRRPLAGAWS